MKTVSCLQAKHAGSWTHSAAIKSSPPLEDTQTLLDHLCRARSSASCRPRLTQPKPEETRTRLPTSATAPFSISAPSTSLKFWWTMREELNTLPTQAYLLCFGKREGRKFRRNLTIAGCGCELKRQIWPGLYQCMFTRVPLRFGRYARLPLWGIGWFMALDALVTGSNALCIAL